jgi:hypothetical protein
MTPEGEILFQGNSFCFTGKLAELKRTQAERETRARGGQTSKVVNEHLDYLVVGSIDATGWKHGSYGRKIEKAMAMHDTGGPCPARVPESEFMRALAKTPSTNAGDIDGKVAVITYSFTAPSRGSFDRKAVEGVLRRLGDEQECHVRRHEFPARVRNELFAARGGATIPSDYLVFEFRIVKHMRLDEPCSQIVHLVESGFQDIDGIDGDLRWFEKAEGSADYIRLLRQLPSNYVVDDL